MAGLVQAPQVPLVWRAPEGLATVPVGGGGAWPGFGTTRSATHSNTAPPVRRAPEGPEGTGGLRDDAPSEARGADGSRAGRRPPAHTAARPIKAAGPDGAQNTSGATGNKNPGT